MKNITSSRLARKTSRLGGERNPPHRQRTPLGRTIPSKRIKTCSLYAHELKAQRLRLGLETCETNWQLELEG